MNNDVKEDYCSFETAKLLKEKGFSWNSTKLVKKEKGKIGFENNNGVPETMDNKFPCYNEDGKEIRPNKFTETNKHYPRATHGLILKWIRINFNVIIEIKPTFFFGERRYHPHFYINEKIIPMSGGPLNGYVTFSTYEVAVEYAIQHCLNIYCKDIK